MPPNGTEPREPDEAADENEELDLDNLEGDGIEGHLFDIPEDDDEEGAPATDTKAPAPAATTDPANAVPPAGAPAADKPRDPVAGKFLEAPPEGAPGEPAGQSPEAKPGEAAQPPTTEAGAQPAEGQPPAGEPAAAAAPSEEYDFTFRADGKVFPIPGAKIVGDELKIPAKLAPDIQRLLSYGTVYQGSFRQKLEAAKTEVATVRAEVHKEVEESKALLKFFGELLDKGPVAVQEWLDDFEKNRPMLEANARVAYAEALEKRPAVKADPVDLPGLTDGTGAAGEPADDFLANVDRDQTLQFVDSSLGVEIRNLVAAEKIAGLSGADLTRIQRAILDDPTELDRYVGIAKESVPDRNIEAGDILLDVPALTKRLKYEAGILAEARKSVQAAVNAEAANSRGAGPAAPPTAAAGGPGGAGKGKKPEKPLPKTKEELDEYMKDDD